MRTNSIYINSLRLLLAALCVLLVSCIMAQPVKRIVVDQNGNGDYKTIQDAVNSLPDSAAKATVIYVKKGVYREKLLITKHNFILEGQDREQTIITQDIARDEWRCNHMDDWGAATINLDGNDVELRNLTIVNDYGFNQKASRTVACPNDSLHAKKIITVNGHQMALRSFRTTRLKAINCRFRAYAGDTVSPWNTVNGMFYFKDCIMEGGVDFYCPRGNAWAENCSFFANTGVASIWHDGSGDSDHKTVLMNCSFDGFPGFNLGRYHRDAQFFLVNCDFSKNMADKDIYLVPTTNTIQWGRRIYYSGCNREGGNYAWHADNLALAKGSPNVADITPRWLFAGKWPSLTN